MEFKTGREEVHENIKKYNERRLSNYPNYFKNFYTIMSAKNYSEKTKRVYIGAICNLLNFLKENGIDIDDSRDLNKVDYVMLSEYIIKIGKKENGDDASTSCVVTHIKAIKRFFEFLCDCGIVDSDPSLSIKYKKDKKRNISRKEFIENGDKPDIKFLNKEQIESVKNIIHSGELEKKGQWMERDVAMIMLFLRTGMRISEVVELNISDINFDKRQIFVSGKGDVNRIVKFGEDMEKDLKVWIELRDNLLYNNKEIQEKAGDALFLSSRFTRMTDQVARNIIKKTTAASGCQINPHSCRKTFAMQTLETTGNIYVVAKLLGHRKVTTTEEYYTTVTDEMERDAIRTLTY